MSVSLVQIKECLYNLLDQVFKKGFEVKVLDLQEYNIMHNMYEAFNCIIITVIEYSLT